MSTRKRTRKAASPEEKPEQQQPTAKAEPKEVGPKATTKRGYKPEDPERYAYMMIESPNVDGRTGRRLSKPYPATFNETDWIQFLKYRTSQNLEVREVLHLPAGWKQPEIFEFEN